MHFNELVEPIYSRFADLLGKFEAHQVKDPIRSAFYTAVKESIILHSQVTRIDPVMEKEGGEGFLKYTLEKVAHDIGKSLIDSNCMVTDAYSDFMGTNIRREVFAIKLPEETPVKNIPVTYGGNE